MFEKIQKKLSEDEEKKAQDEALARVAKINELKDKIIGILKETDLSVQDTSFVLDSTMKSINQAIVNKKLTDCI